MNLLIKFVFIPILLINLVACSGGGSDPAPKIDPNNANVAGIWQINEDIDNTACGGTGDTDSYQITIGQRGDSLTVTTPHGTFTGAISGTKFSWSGEFYNGDMSGWLTITSMSMTVDGDTFSGSISWDFRELENGPIVCSGTVQVSADRTGTGNVPTAPSGLTATVTSDTEVSLSWIDNANDEDGYRVERSTGNSNSFEVIATLGSDSTTYNDSGLTPSTTYYYRVVAYNNFGDSSYSSSSSAATQAEIPPALEGFDFALSTGDYWEYQWDYYYNSWSQTSGSTTEKSGAFRVTLGNATLIEGITAYEVILSGAGQATASKDFAPHWQYIAMANHRMYGSVDGSTLETIFDAKNGYWIGGGFFVAFPENSLITASPGQISNDYITSSAYVVSESDSESQCEYFPGVGTICGDSSFTYVKRQYFGADIGPLGYYYYNAFSDCGGGFCSGATWEDNVGLVSSSLRGDSVDYELDTEPNNSIANAQLISVPATVRGTFYSEDLFGDITSVSLNSTNETEPNDSLVQAQQLPNYMRLSGDTMVGDSGSIFTFNDFPTAGNTYQTTIEDFYGVVLADSRNSTLEVLLDFVGYPTADLDMILIRQSDMTIIDSSIQENPATGEPTESFYLYTNLAAGTYYILVDAYATPDGRVPYTLNIDSTFLSQNNIDIHDWYTLTLGSQSSLTVTSIGGAGIVLTDETGQTVYSYDLPASSGETTSFTTGMLDAGTYLLGLSDTVYSDNLYTLTITTN